MKRMGVLFVKIHGKMSIVSINMDRKKDLAINSIYENSWFSLDHFYLDHQMNSLENYEIDQSSAYVMIFGADKILKLACNPTIIDLENVIDQIIKGEYNANLDKNCYKAFSKKMKNEVVKILNMEASEKITKGLTITWKKQISYDLNGTMFSFNYEKPDMVMSYNIKYTEKAEKIEAKIYALFEKGKETFSSVEINIKNSMEKLNEAAKQLRILLNLNDLKEIPIVYKVRDELYWNQDNEKFLLNRKQ